MNEDGVRQVEIGLLLEGLQQVHGYDFRQYNEASLRRRLEQWLSGTDYLSFGAALSAVLRDAAACEALVRGITVNVTEMFRDPAFFLALRKDVVPYLQTWPHAKLWVAGCATGEEVYSLAIVLHEEGLIERCRIYATDINQKVLETAQKGIYPLKSMQQYTRNYQKAGGRAAFSDYYQARYDHAIMDPGLRRNVLFAVHNLVTDADFSEMQLILCRNVLIYFQPTLKAQVIGLFDRCLTPGGFLCLGAKEVLEGYSCDARYAEQVPRSRIYRKGYT